MTKYRDRLEIIADILTAVQNESKKTRIMYRTNLSYRLLMNYLELAMKAGLICLRDGGHYKITERGRSFLKQCVKFLEYKRRLSERISVVEDIKEKLEFLCSSQP